MKILGRILAPLTLFEWGGILTYFYFSGRIAAFLHPMFRPLILITGILLLITALCVAIFPEEECDHEHGEDSHQHDHTHGRLGFGGFLAFVVLLLPLALAAKISPDSYGETLIKNRGLVEDIRSVPGAATSFAKRVKSAEDTAQSSAAEEKPSLTVTTEKTSPSPRIYIGVPEQTPSPTQNADAEPALPSDNYEQQIPSSPAASSSDEFVNEALKPDKSGHIRAEIVDLLYAAQEAYTRKDFEGKDVELIGQLVPRKAKRGTESQATVGSFKLLRLVMVCCAADAMPVAVKVEGKPLPKGSRDMQWLKVTGRVSYRTRVKDDNEDTTDYGDTPEPVIVADTIKRIEPPSEKYLY